MVDSARRGSLSRIASSIALWALACALSLPLLFASACGSSPTYNWKAENAIGYRIGPGDVIKINVWKHDELSQQVTVRPDGKFSLPLVGDIDANGRTVDEIGADISK